MTAKKGLKKKSLTIRLTVEERELLDRLAKDEDRTVTMIVSRALRGYAHDSKALKHP